MSEMLAAGRKVYGELKNLCVWNKTNAGMGSFYACDVAAGSHYAKAEALLLTMIAGRTHERVTADLRPHDDQAMTDRDAITAAQTND